MLVEEIGVRSTENAVNARTQGKDRVIIPGRASNPTIRRVTKHVVVTFVRER
jgi:hypothetical protein